MIDQNTQMARLALQLLGRATVQMGELDAAMAVRQWLMNMAEPQPQMAMPPGVSIPAMNGADHTIVRPPAEG